MSDHVEHVGRLFQRRPEWFDRAMCAPRDGDVDPAVVDMFFPSSTDMNHRVDVNVVRDYEEDAKALCRACPVRAECLEYGLDEPSGIWGGRTARERRYIRRRLAERTA